MKGYLVLADGTVYQGRSLGVAGKVVGEVVFNTTMTGYQRVLTDPSNRGLIINLTYPLIGNYGINHEEDESDQVQVSGLVMRECCALPNHWLNEGTLSDYLKSQKVIALDGIDTRALTRRLRAKGSLPGVLWSGELGQEEVDHLIEEARQTIIHDQRNLVVSTAEPYVLSAPADGAAGDPFQESTIFSLKQYHPSPVSSSRPGQGRRVVVIDYGVNRSLLRNLYRLGLETIVVPQTYTAQQILELKPAGIVLSNGPVSQAVINEAVITVKDLLEAKIPILGICLGHLILGTALGGKVQKMVFGHRGGNHPVQDLDNGQVLITAQNHGYVLEESSLDTTAVRVNLRNLHDKTIEGIEHRQLPFFSVQYLPAVTIPIAFEDNNPFGRFLQFLN
ncbi:MAG: glutamine-hydrolyzing carbamoyl-phosphate synthase small subunit [Syntrophomonadaceae bacterium]|nr:glutamine-hydrolyzing carbamoyl-phosphate synthase small subunit [Syntrophomonadaceae bacterium]